MQPFITNLPIVHADFWHIQSIVSRLQEHVTQPTLVGHVNKVLAILPDPSVQSFPFFHQFTALAGLTIAEFAVQKGADGVANEANALDHVLSVRSGKEGGWEQAIGNFVMSATGGSSAMIGLQGLAEVAVGDGQAAREVFDGKFEPVKVLREGYLSFFVPLPKN